MPPLIEREAIRREVGRLGQWLLDGAAKTTTSAGAADNSTLIDSSLYSTVRHQHIRQGSPIAIITAGATNDARGQRRYATGPPDTAGTVTVSPVFSLRIDGSVNYEVWDPDGPHPDEIDRCIDRALSRACWFWTLQPLTQIPGGEFGPELSVSTNNLIDPWGNTLWTATSVTTTLPNLEPPDEYTRRVCHIVAGATPGYLQSQSISVDPDNRPAWFVQGLVRTGGASDSASIIPYDVTNSAAITAQSTNTWTRIGWGRVYTSFTLPATCEQLAFRLQAAASGDIAEFAAIQAFQQEQHQVSLPRRVPSKRHVGPVVERHGTYYGEFRRSPWRGSLERREAAGRGVLLDLDPAPGQSSLWYYEKTPFPVLSSDPVVAADDDTQTWAVLEWVAQATLVECYESLKARDWKEAPDRWDRQLAEAQGKLISLQDEYGIEPMLSEDSPRPRGVVNVRV